jgi:hypothetical protein
MEVVKLISAQPDNDASKHLSIQKVCVCHPNIELQSFKGFTRTFASERLKFD